MRDWGLHGDDRGSAAVQRCPKSSLVCFEHSSGGCPVDAKSRAAEGNMRWKPSPRTEHWMLMLFRHSGGMGWSALMAQARLVALPSHFIPCLAALPPDSAAAQASSDTVHQEGADDQDSFLGSGQSRVIWEPEEGRGCRTPPPPSTSHQAHATTFSARSAEPNLGPKTQKCPKMDKIKKFPQNSGKFLLFAEP